MNNYKKGLLLSFLTFFSLVSYSQKDYSILFQANKVEVQENCSSFDWNNAQKYNGGYYVWMQFYSTPVQSVQDELKANGVLFLEYISKSTYLTYVPNSFSNSLLVEKGVRGISTITSNLKTTAGLINGDIENWAIDGQRIILNILVYDNISLESVVSDLLLENVQIKEKNKGSNIATISILESDFEKICKLPYIQWVEQIPAPAKKEDTRGRSLHRSSNLDTQTSAGRNYTGDGIGVLVRDDGIVGPHIDFQGRIDNSGANTTGTTHGDGVAGIMAGAGNLNPLMRGMAAGSDVYVSNYASNFLDAVTTSLINSGDVQITNSSYSDGCNGGYTTGTQTVDQQIKNTPSLLHVFSAGNSGTSNCSYGAGAGWGNITGGHKQGKNVIATANVYFDGSLVNSSSRGPAYDGRIKPDIAANGQNQNSTDEDNTYMSFGGTSGASPGIAGISAQLYEAYSDANGGVLPQSALIKAALLNTANDYGNVGPDYKYGWGIVNGLRAAQLIEDNHFISSTVTQGNSSAHIISIPAGTKQVRFMVYWSDPAASPGATTCLINDLDLTVTIPSNTTLYPWILDPTPNAINLNTPATNGVDHLNNMEQIVVNNPTAGNYTLNISGYNIPMGPQEYFIVYEVIDERVTVTYPNMGESFVPGETESLHWDAVNTSGSFLLEYSANNGTTWNNIATVAGTETNYAWIVPNLITGNAKIRVTNGTNIDISDDVFSIAQLVTGQQITKVCPDSATFSWTAVANAQSYDLFILGVKYMEVAGTSSTMSITVPISNPLSPIWYAVSAKNSTLSWQGRRSIASYYPGGLLNCSLPNDLELTSINNPIGDFSAACNGGDSAILSISITNTGVNSQSNFPVSYQVNSSSPVIETYPGTIASGQQVTYIFPVPVSGFVNGASTLTCKVSLVGDQIVSNNQQILSFYNQSTATTTPFIETFDPSGTPLLWSILNPDSNISWEVDNVVGATGTSTNAMKVNHYNYSNASGEVDILQTEVFAIGGTVSTLTFDLAKAQYSSTLSDELKVEISTDCGTTYQNIYQKAGAVLATTTVQTGNWSPGVASDWRNETIDLTSFGTTSALFRFSAINGYGNSTYLDNINLSSDLGIKEETLIDFNLYPNPTSGLLAIKINNDLASDFTVLLTNQLAQNLKVVHITGDNSKGINFDLSEFAQGIYFVTVNSEGKTTTKRIVKY
jgi:hypothetical protein